MIKDIVKEKDINCVSINELKKALKSINKGKSPDINGLVIEHIVYAGDAAMELLLSAINNIFRAGVVPDSLKTGILTPSFKNKETKTMPKTIEVLRFFLS